MASHSIKSVARRLRVTPKALRKAIRSGRVDRGVTTGPGGRVVITDGAAVMQAFRDNRDDSQDRNGQAKGPTLLAAELRVKAARAEKLEQDAAERSGRLVPADDVEDRWTTRVVRARTKLLGLPSRIKQRVPHLTVAELAEIDGLVREALEELADESSAPLRQGATR